MLEIVFPFAGGIGLFLVGMMMLSEGLVAFGGDVMKQALARFTGTPSKAILSGTLAKMVVQSSSATTVTLIGFVSAGLITFTQAIGVVMGASLGNTATGWIVAGLGLKVNLGFYTLPLIGVGALLKLLAKGRWAALGMAAAGFGMMFLGLNTLQEGMRGVSSVFSFSSLPDGGYIARWVTMLIGLALTAVLQSSTAAIATTLTALHTGTINFEQAAALVVGAAIGTTVTGALAAMWGRRFTRSERRWPTSSSTWWPALWRLCCCRFSLRPLHGWERTLGWMRARAAWPLSIRCSLAWGLRCSCPSYCPLRKRWSACCQSGARWLHSA